MIRMNFLTPKDQITANEVYDTYYSDQDYYIAMYLLNERAEEGMPFSAYDSMHNICSWMKRQSNLD